MSKFFDSLLAPEWRKFVHPGGFADGVLTGIRSLCDRIANIAKLKIIDTTTRPYYQPISIKTEDITYNKDTAK